MSDLNKQDPSDDPELGLESMMDQIEQLDPAQLSDMSPEQIQALLGGAKLGELFAKFQQHAGEMAAEVAKQQGMSLDQLDDEQDDGWFDADDDAFSEDSIDESWFERPTGPDGSFAEYPGSQQLWQAALALEHDDRLQVSVEVTSPPVTRIEKVYYSKCHYRLVFDLFDTKVMFRDVTTPRQNYLHGNGWPAMLLLPRATWPDLEVLWDTIQVEQFNLREAFRSNSHNRIARQELLPFAKQALNAALNGEHSD